MYRKFFAQNSARKVLFFLTLFFFWSSADIVLTYLLPVLIEDTVSNLLLLGIIVSAGSFMAVIFNMITSWRFAGRHYRFFYLAGFMIALLVPIFLFIPGVWPLLVLTILAGLYYEMFSFGHEEFLGNHVPHREHVKTSGMIMLVVTISSILLPMIIAPSLEQRSFDLSFFLYISFAVIGLLFFILFAPQRSKDVQHAPSKMLSFVNELKIWKLLSRNTYPVLLVMVILMILDAIYWTLGPLLTVYYAKQSPELAALFVPVYIIPGLAVTYYAPKWADKFGEVKAMLFSLGLSGIFLILFLLSEDLHILLALGFISGFFSSLSYTLTEGLFAHLIDRLNEQGTHLIGLRGVAIDLGYIIGPFLGGLMAEYFSIKDGFAYTGIIMVIAALYLFFKYGRTIRLQQIELKKIIEED